jgi:hypothetical protein
VKSHAAYLRVAVPYGGVKIYQSIIHNEDSDELQVTSDELKAKTFLLVTRHSSLVTVVYLLPRLESLYAAAAGL